MQPAELVRRLTDAFGADAVTVRSQYHVHVTMPGLARHHDVWLNGNGQLSWRLSGARGTHTGPPNKLIAEIERHDPRETDLGQMQAALELSRAIGEAGRFALSRGIRAGIFVDAGQKDGAARISVIAIDGDEVEALRKPVEAATIVDAERLAIDFALERFPGDVPVYSDNQAAVRATGNPRVRWISRKLNGAADAVANLRGGPA